MTTTTEYRVSWRRAGWVHSHQRIISDRRAVDRLIAKLRRHDRPELMPVVELVVDERRVGRWETKRVVVPTPRRVAS